MVGLAGGRVVWEEGNAREQSMARLHTRVVRGRKCIFCFVLFWRYICIYFLPPFSRAIPVPERELVDSHEALAE